MKCDCGHDGDGYPLRVCGSHDPEAADGCGAMFLACTIDCAESAATKAKAATWWRDHACEFKTGVLQSAEAALYAEHAAEIERQAQGIRGRLSAAEFDNKRLRDGLVEIHAFAHDNSTGPETPDALWTVRQMAENVLAEKE